MSFSFPPRFSTSRRSPAIRRRSPIKSGSPLSRRRYFRSFPVLPKKNLRQQAKRTNHRKARCCYKFYNRQVPPSAIITIIEMNCALYCPIVRINFLNNIFSLSRILPVPYGAKTCFRKNPPFPIAAADNAKRYHQSTSSAESGCSCSS